MSTMDRDQMIISMYNAGDSLEDIVRKTGLTKEWIGHILRDYGLVASFSTYTKGTRLYKGFATRWNEAVNLVKPHLV